MEIQDFNIDQHTALMTIIVQDGEGYANTVEFMQWLVKWGYAKSFIGFCDVLVPHNGHGITYRDLLNHYGHDQLMDWVQHWVNDAANVKWHLEDPNAAQNDAYQDFRRQCGARKI